MKDMRSAAIYLATVVKIGEKATNFGRIKVVMDNKEIMSHPIWASAAGVMDNFWMPAVGDRVFIFFESGSWNDVYWFGFRYCTYAMTDPDKEPQSAIEGYPDSRVVKTKSGHEICFDDKVGSEKIQITTAIKDGKQHKVLLDTAAEQIVVEHSSGKAKITIKPDGSVDIITEDVNWISKHVQLQTGAVAWTFGKNMEIVDGEGNSVKITPNNIEIKDKHKNTILLQDGIKLTDKDGSTITMKGGKIQITAKGKVYLNGGSKGVVRAGDNAVPHVHVVVSPHGPCSVSPALVKFQKVSTTVIAGG